MPLTDSTNVAFSSTWDIDKIVGSGTTSTTVNAGLTNTASVDNTYGYRPYVIAQYKPSTQTTWFDPGENSQFSTSQLVTMSVWVSTTLIDFFCVNGHGSSVTVDIRYWVLSDGA
jgi:hypothetical protein